MYLIKSLDFKKCEMVFHLYSQQNISNVKLLEYIHVVLIDRIVHIKICNFWGPSAFPWQISL